MYKKKINVIHSFIHSFMLFVFYGKEVVFISAAFTVCCFLLLLLLLNRLKIEFIVIFVCLFVCFCFALFYNKIKKKRNRRCYLYFKHFFYIHRNLNKKKKIIGKGFLVGSLIASEEREWERDRAKEVYYNSAKNVKKIFNYNFNWLLSTLLSRHCCRTQRQPWQQRRQLQPTATDWRPTEPSNDSDWSRRFAVAVDAAGAAVVVERMTNDRQADSMPLHFGDEMHCCYYCFHQHWQHWH